MEVHFFAEYHGSTEQDYGNIAKGCEEESTINDDTHQRRGHNVHTVVTSMLRQITQARRRALVKRHKQRVIPIVSDELRERYCHVVNEQVW